MKWVFVHCSCEVSLTPPGLPLGVQRHSQFSCCFTEMSYNVLACVADGAAAPAEAAPKKKKKKAIEAGEQAAADVARAVVEKTEGEKKKKKKKKASEA